ncbi:MAG: serine hydrolase domain-containing protein [Anaerolineaceae bacterium]
MKEPRCFFYLLVLIALVSGCFPTELTQPSSPTTTITISPSSSNTSVPLATKVTDDQVAASLKSALNDFAAKNNLSGVVLVSRFGRLVFSQGYGKARDEIDVPNSPSVKYHIMSLTKQFTAMSILLLQQEEKLNVQDPICKYIENCPKTWEPITIHQLLIHTSGIHDINNIPGIQKLFSHPVTPNQIINQFRDLPLDFTPGEKFSFSNSGYYLLGTIIEKVSGQSYPVFLEKQIFVPLQMKNTVYEGDLQTGSDFAMGYIKGTTPVDFFDKSIGYASTGLYSTVGDLLLWEQSFDSEKLAGKAIQDEINKSFIQVPPLNAQGGYLWFFDFKFDQPIMFYKCAAAGFSNQIVRFPQSGFTVIVLSNHMETDLTGLSDVIFPIISGKP